MLKRFLPLLIITLWLLFFIKGLISLDPDFGWHIRMGQLILASGIPAKDPFSYTMPSFPFVDHEWLTNFILYMLYSSIGYVGLSVMFATLALLALLIDLPKKLLQFSLAPLLLSAAIILPFSGIRPQVITWLMLSILLNYLFRPEIWKKVRFFIPIFFTLWANLHGGFAIGIAFLVLNTILSVWQTRKIDLVDLLVTIASIAATLINPYGIRLWGEVWMQISDGSLHFTIAEWVPILFRFDLAYLFLATTSLVLMFKYRSKFSLKEKIFFGLLLIMGLSSQRHVPLWIVVGLSLSVKAIYILSEDVKKYRLGNERFVKVNKFFLIAAFLVFMFQCGWIFISVKKISEDNFYPKQAITFIKDHYFAGELFAPYDFGGYLIWKLPEKKVFVDGRMPSWRYVGPGKESSYAYRDYNEILFGKEDFKDFFKKYNITTVLWIKPAPQKDSDILKFISSFHLTLLNQIFNLQESKIFVQKLENEGWKQLYQDQIAVIYQRP